MGDVVPLQVLSPAAASRLVRQISRYTNRIEFTEGASAQMGRLRVGRLQVIDRCRTAAISEKPAIDTYGNTRVTFSGYESGEAIVIEAVITTNEAGDRCLIVISVALETWPDTMI